MLNDHTSAIADHVNTTGHNIKWDHFEIVASGISDYHCKRKETLFMQDLKPAFNVNISGEKLAFGKSDYHSNIKETLFTQDLKSAFNVNISSEKICLISFPDSL